MTGRRALVMVAGQTSELPAADPLVGAAYFGALNLLGSGTIGGYTTAAVISSSSVAIAMAADRMELVPFVPSQDIVSTNFGVQVTTAVAAATAKFVVYSSLSTGYPDSVLIETLTVDCSTTGFKSIAAVQTFKAGVLYWLGIRSNSTQTLTGFGAGALRGFNRPNMALGTVESLNIRRTLTYATAATTPFGAIAPGEMNGNTPSIFAIQTW